MKAENVENERRTLAVPKYGYPAGTVVDVFYRAEPFVAVRVVATGATVGGIHEETELALPPLRQVVSV